MEIIFENGKNELQRRIYIDGMLMERNKGNYYYCPICKCGAKVVTNDSKEIVGVGYYNQHDLKKHNAKDIQECIDKQNEEMEKKRKYQQLQMDLICNPLMDLKSIAKQNGFATLSSSQISTIKKNGKKKYRIPTTFEDLSQENHNLILANKGEEIVIFGQLSGLLILAETDVILADGTFRIVNNNGQMFIMHATVGDNVITCLFVKMLHRNIDSYVLMFKMIEKLCLDLGITIFSKEVIFKADFESAVISTLSTLYPQIKFSGCFFHFSQSVMKRIRSGKCNLIKEYRKKKEFYRLVRRITCTALLPLNYINKVMLETIFTDFTLKVSKLPINFELFKKYIVDTWYGFGNKAAKFPPFLWNVSSCPKRTNNDSESLHKLINKEIRKKLDVGDVLQLIKNVFLKENQIFEEYHEITKTEKKLTVKKNELIEIFKRKLDDNKVFFIDYLDEVAEIIKLKNITEANNWEAEHCSSNYVTKLGKNKNIKQQRKGVFQTINTPTQPPERTVKKAIPQVGLEGCQFKKFNDDQKDFAKKRNEKTESVTKYNSRISIGFVTKKLPLKREPYEVTVPVPEKKKIDEVLEENKQLKVQINELNEKLQIIIQTLNSTQNLN